MADLHYAWWSHRFYTGADPLFPGVVPLALALVAVGSGLAWRDRRARMLLVAGLVGGALSFGPSFPPYVWLYHALPVFQGIRGPARFGYVAILAVGVLAGFGLAFLRRRWAGGSRASSVLAVGAAVAIALVNVEAFTTHEFTRFDRIPALYDLLAAESQAVVLELPLWPSASVHQNAAAVFASTRHWHPLVNGYSGFTPRSYEAHATILRSLPDGPSLALLDRLGVTHVVVHRDREPAAGEALDAHPAFRLVRAAGDLRLYRFLNRAERSSFEAWRFSAPAGVRVTGAGSWTPLPRRGIVLAGVAAVRHFGGAGRPAGALRPTDTPIFGRRCAHGLRTFRQPRRSEEGDSSHQAVRQPEAVRHRGEPVRLPRRDRRVGPRRPANPGVDNQSTEDVTAHTLTQVILEEGKRGTSTSPPISCTT